MSKIKVAIVGASGYTGAELLRLLIHHINVQIVSAISQSNAGKKVSEVFTDFQDECDLFFTEAISANTDVIFLCLPHGESAKYLLQNPGLLQSKIIDLGRDFRLKTNSHILKAEFIYGLPELNKTDISKATFVANPGCFATCIELSLLPLAKNNLLNSNIYVNATTGSTGAGIKPGDTTHFSWRQNNLSVYKPFEHNHNEEILQSINQLQSDFKSEFIFIPQRGSFTRGIFASIIIETEKSENELKSIYSDYFAAHPFTKLVDKETDLKMVVNTNKCFIHLKKHKNKLLITAVIDNLLKGASGQAVQNMNLMFGLNETEGLKLKSLIY